MNISIRLQNQFGRLLALANSNKIFMPDDGQTLVIPCGMSSYKYCYCAMMPAIDHPQLAELVRETRHRLAKICWLSIFQSEDGDL